VRHWGAGRSAFAAACLALVALAAAGCSGTVAGSAQPSREQLERANKLFAKARADRAGERIPEAIAGFEEGIKLAPDDFEAVVDLCRLYSRSAFTTPRVVELLEAYVARHPTSRDGLMELGVISTQSYTALNYERSEKHLLQLRKLRPKDAEPIFWLGEVYLKAGRFEEAIKAYDELLAEFPLHMEGLYGRAVAKMKLGRTKEAIEDLTRVVEADPVPPEYRLLLRQLSEEQGGYPSDFDPLYRFDDKARRYRPSKIRFRDVGQEAGVKIPRASRASGWADYDGDGYLDLVAAATFQPIRLYHNQGDGTFVDKAKECGIGEMPGWATLWADYDNDGDPDLFVGRTGWAGPNPNSLYRNEGGRFVDVTDTSGLKDAEGACFTASWADFDRDGWLDLWVGNFYGGQDRLFRNRGDGTFVDVLPQMGITDHDSTVGVTWGDYDRDGYPDLFATNLDGDNRLYHNLKGKDFEEIAGRLGVTRPLFSYAPFFLDVDGDGWMDLYCSGHCNQNFMARWHEAGGPEMNPQIRGSLYLNDRKGGFRDITQSAGLSGAYGAMSATFGDLNNDGLPEIFLCNGGPEMGRIERSVLFENRGGKRFVEIGEAAGVDYLGKGHGPSVADYDNDGRLDLYFGAGAAHRGDQWPCALYRNESPLRSWIAINLRGTTSNRDGIGARAEIRSGGRTLTQERSGGCGFGVTNTPFLHFGLAESKGPVDVMVSWPSGRKEAYRALAVNRAWRLEEGKPAAPHAYPGVSKR
jgi:tetratricopeptide (TPR) repeat protein